MSDLWHNTHILMPFLLIMGFDCSKVHDQKNIILHGVRPDSDSLVNDQILSEIGSNPERDASFTNY
jgi:hypothetical protein